MPHLERSSPDEYAATLAALKAQVHSARLKAQRNVNTRLVELYWNIGRTILRQQEIQGWGSSVVGRLANDLRAEFPEMKGFSRRNLLYMRAFAGVWPEPGNVQQPVAQLPRGHITVLLDRLRDRPDRDWYAAMAVDRAWSRNMLTNQIANRTRERIGAAPSNFPDRLDSPDSDLARQLAKDPFVFDFLDLTADAAERDLEQALLDRIVDTLREFGTGFAFVGRQVHFDVDGDDFFLDLLFFHVEQLRYVVVELETGRFQPEYAGKLGFYVALVDERRRLAAHAPTVGILICRSRNEHTVRYSLGRADSPMAVSTYSYDTLPEEERSALPDAERLAGALSWDGEDADRARD